MKRSYEIAAISAITLAFLGIAHHHAQATEQAAPGDTAVTAVITGAPSPKQEVELSEHGLSAMNNIHLARMAVNDGYVDSARKLLGEAQKLLAEVKKEDPPITVTTDVKVGGKEAEHDRKKERMDLIPIISELQVVEAFDAPAQKNDAEAQKGADTSHAASPQTAEPKTAAATPAQTTTAPKADEQAGADKTKAKATAIAKAREHLRSGDRKAAIEDLRLEDLTLISKVIGMPLAETGTHVDKALALIDQGRLHDANLELKKVQDELVLSATVVQEPTNEAKPDHTATKAG